MPGTERVILIDDSDIDLIIQRRFLEVFNFTTELVQYKSAEEALDFLKKLNGNAPPDVIFLDLNMPEMDGFDFLNDFNTLPDSIKDPIKIVVLSSSTNVSDRNEVLAHKNVIHYITKPIKQTDIEDVRKLILVK